MEQPTKPNLPYTDILLRVAIPEPVEVTFEQYAEQLTQEPNFKCKEVLVYTKEQLEAYGQAMHLHGIAESQYIAEQYCDSMMLRFANAKDVARALHNHFHHMRTNYDKNRG